MKTITGILFSLLLPMAVLAGTVKWEPPTTSVDGTPLTNLAGFKIYYTPLNQKFGEGTKTVDVSDPLAKEVEVPVNSKTHWFLIQAYTTDGKVSSYATPSDYSIPDLSPSNPTTVIIINHQIGSSGS